jgi:nucleotide-binding universal stress UspA family protein
MKQFRSILLVVPADGTDVGPALEQAAELATRNSAKLTLTSTVETIPERRLKRTRRQGLDLQATLLEDRTKQLEQIAGRYQSDDLPIGVEVDVGVPFVEIIRRVLKSGHDLVITPEESGLVGFGAMPKHLLRKCTCPVWVIRPGPAQHLRVLAAIGPDEGDAGPLNELIMDLATSLTALEEGELDIVHTWVLEGESSLRSSPFVSIPSAEVDLMAEVACDEHAQALDALVGRHDLSSIKHTVHLIKGVPERIIPTLVSEKSTNLIVMGTVARSGIAGLVIGNTAERILDMVDCSVVAVKPEGFVSPVTISV